MDGNERLPPSHLHSPDLNYFKQKWTKKGQPSEGPRTVRNMGSAAHIERGPGTTLRLRQGPAPHSKRISLLEGNLQGGDGEHIVRHAPIGWLIDVVISH